MLETPNDKIHLLIEFSTLHFRVKLTATFKVESIYISEIVVNTNSSKI
jgi:hypothetical protein